MTATVNANANVSEAPLSPDRQIQKVQEVQEVPGVSTKLKEEHLSHLYIMFYRHGMNANLTKGFYCAGNLMEAAKRAREHCKIMNYHFIFIRPMVCNLEVEEEYKLKGAAEGELVP